MIEREGGFIALHRQIESWSLWPTFTAEHRYVVICLLLHANWKDTTSWFGTQRIEVKRGQLYASEDTIAGWAGTSRKIVRTVLARLMAEGFITRQMGQHAGRKPSVLTITNYEKFQKVEEHKGQQKGQQRASKGPAAGLQGAPSEQREQGEQGEPPTVPFSNENGKTPPPQAPVLAFIRSRCPGVTLDGAAARQVINRLKAGDAPDLVAAIAVVGLSDFNLDNVLVALSKRYRLRIVDSEAPHAAHLQELRNAFASEAAQHSRPRNGHGVSAGNGEREAPLPLRLPAVGAVSSAGQQSLDDPRRSSGPVQNHPRVVDGGQPGHAIKAGLLAWTRNAAGTAGS